MSGLSSKNMPESCKVDVQLACKLIDGEGAWADARIAWELLHCLRNLTWPALTGGPSKQLNELATKLWARTIEIVEEDSAMILGLAGNLTTRVIEAGVDKAAVFPAPDIEVLPAVMKWVDERGLTPAANH